MSPSQITMWDRQVREVPYERLEQAFQLADIPHSLIDPALRFLRSFLDAAEGRNSDDFGLEAELIAAESAAREASDPREAAELAKLAGRVGERRRWG